MGLNIVDGAIILLMALGFIHGVIKGAIQEVAAGVAIVVGVWVAGRAAEGTVSVTGQLSHPTAGKIFVFVIAFIVVAVLVIIFGRMLSNMVKKSALSGVDRFLGGVIGACIVALIAGLLFKLMFMGGLESGVISRSAIAPRLVNAVSHFARFLASAPDRAELTGVIRLPFGS